MKISIKKIICILIVAICLISFITSTLASGFDAGHECAGEDCSVCFYISLREITAEYLCILAIILSVFALILIVRFIFITAEASLTSETPVRLKVKLSN